MAKGGVGALPLLRLTSGACTSFRGAEAMWRCYRAALSRQPLLTQAATSASLMAASDALCQAVESPRRWQAPELHTARLEEPRPGYDWQRSARMAAVGLLYCGPVAHAWYLLLERIVPVKSGLGSLACKMALDATLYSPVSIVGYVALKSKLEGNDIGGVASDVQSKWWTALLASWSFWPVANIFNFAFVPVQLRVLYNNTLSLGWNAILWNLTSQQRESVEAPLQLLWAPLLRAQRELAAQLEHLWLWPGSVLLRLHDSQAHSPNASFPVGDDRAALANEDLGRRRWGEAGPTRVSGQENETAKVLSSYNSGVGFAQAVLGLPIRQAWAART